jgi:FKBP12-rapamycin complex-associated protein
MEALACVGSLAKAMGPAMEEHVRGLLDVMFSAGLTPTLVEALESIVSRYHFVDMCMNFRLVFCSSILIWFYCCGRLPSLLPTIQERLLDSISFVLAKSSYRSAKSTGVPGRSPVVPSSPQSFELNGPALVQLALTTLTTFPLEVGYSIDFSKYWLVCFNRNKRKIEGWVKF